MMNVLLTRRLLGAAGVIGALAIIGCVFSQIEVWEGGFVQAEYQIRCVDHSGKPVQGVELHVVNAKGLPSFNYPIIEYQRRNTPKSDTNGIIIVHHIATPMEYSGRCQLLFGFIRLGKNCDGPQFHFRFEGPAEQDTWIPYRELNALHPSGTVERLILPLPGDEELADHLQPNAQLPGIRRFSVRIYTFLVEAL